MHYTDEVFNGLNTMKVMLDDGAFLPERAHSQDAGLDLRTPYEIKVPAHGSAIIDTGVRVAFPAGCYGKLESKSGLHVKHDVVCLGGVIDNPYRGSIVVKLYNMGDKDYWFAKGDKVVQMVILKCETPVMVKVEELDETDRNTDGFGSTGR